MDSASGVAVDGLERARRGEGGGVKGVMRKSRRRWRCIDIS